jgi:hypothetical protein
MEVFIFLVICVVGNFKVIYATKYEAPAAAALYIGNIHNYQV